MVATWLNPDGLYKKFGTLKTVPNTGGEYRTAGGLREIELTVTLAGLTTSPVVQNDEVFYPIGMQLQEVETEVQTAAVGGTSLSMGLMSTDRTTVTGNGLSNTFVAAVNTVPGYITALAAGTYSAGVLKVRIRYYKPGTN